MKIGVRYVIQIWITTFKKLLKQSGGCKVIKINHDFLIEKQNSLNRSSNKLPFTLDVRVRRALSWIKQAECIEDTNSDNRFLFYWIAFNALYSSKIEDGASHTNEHHVYRAFFNKVLKVDKRKRIYNMVWGPLKPQFRQLINNKYLFGYFWKFHNGDLESERWEPIFLSMNKNFEKNIKHDDVPKALAEVFSRLYVLRNQMIHGGSTWGGDRNRNQVKICSRVISLIVPLMIDIMLESPDTDWKELHYPILDKEDKRLGDEISLEDGRNEGSPDVDEKSSVELIETVERQDHIEETTSLFGFVRKLFRRLGRRD